MAILTQINLNVYWIYASFSLISFLSPSIHFIHPVREMWYFFLCCCCCCYCIPETFSSKCHRFDFQSRCFLVNSNRIQFFYLFIVLYVLSILQYQPALARDRKRKRERTMLNTFQYNMVLAHSPNWYVFQFDMFASFISTNFMFIAMSFFFFSSTII